MGKPEGEEPSPDHPTEESADNVSSTVSPLPVKPVPKKAGGGDRWSHDRFDMSEQAPKSRTELVSAYGYDIRSEEGPPKVKRSKHYGRGPTKYDRNWEDENAYGKQVVAKRVPRGPPKGEDFPRLNERRPKRTSQPRSDDQSAPEGSEDGGHRSYSNNNNNHNHSRDSNHSHSSPRDQNRVGERERRQSGGGRTDRGGGRGGGRGNEKSREFKNRSQAGRSMGGGGGERRDGRDSRDSGSRPQRRGGDSEGNPSQQSFNGMSFTNSSLGHGKRVEYPAGTGTADVEDMPQRMMPTATSARSVNYGSGRLQRRDQDKPSAGPPQSAQQHQVGSGVAVTPGEIMAGVGLPLHATTVPHHNHQQQQQQQPQMPKRYSEKRQQQQQQSVGMAQQQQTHLQQSSGPPPPPFMSNRSYVQMDAGVSVPQQQQMMQPQPQQQQQQGQPAALAQPIPAQYANYYAPDFLPQSTPQASVAAAAATNQQRAIPNVAYQSQGSLPQAPANGPPAQQMMNYVPAMQVAPPPNPAQYSQYPGYQSYAPLVSSIGHRYLRHQWQLATVLMCVSSFRSPSKQPRPAMWPITPLPRQLLWRRRSFQRRHSPRPDPSCLSDGRRMRFRLSRLRTVAAKVVGDWSAKRPEVEWEPVLVGVLATQGMRERLLPRVVTTLTTYL